MRRVFGFLFTVVLCLSLVACSKDAKSKSSAEDYSGVHYEAVIAELKKAGFTNIRTEVIDDLTSDSSMIDGAVEHVSINGVSDFTAKDTFPKDAEVKITYHIIKKLTLPLSSTDIQGSDYETIGGLFKNAGFTNVKIERLIDLDPDAIESDYVNEVTINGNASFSESEEQPFDADISVVGHFPYEKYTVNMHVDFIPNLLFNKYDVNVSLDGEKQFTIEHGKDVDYQFSLGSGEYTITFSNAESSSVKGEIQLEVTSDVDVSYKINCDRDNVGVQTVSIDVKRALAENEVMVVSSEKDYLGENYEKVIAELTKAGFTNIKTMPVYDIFDGSTMAGLVSTVKIGGTNNYKQGDIVNKDVEIIVSYRMPDEDDPGYQPTETSSIPTTEPTEPSQTNSIYEIAYLRKAKDYSSYMLFDLDGLVVRYFTTNDNGVSVGTLTGDLSKGISIFYNYDGGWIETMKHKNPSSDSIAILTGYDGFESEWTKANVAEAEAILTQPGYHDMAPNP